MNLTVNMTPVTLPRCASEWPEKVRAAARKALRCEIAEANGGAAILKKNIVTDAAIEQIWNAVIEAFGHDDMSRYK